MEWDIVIVGGGLSGLYLARILVDKGLKPMIVEAEEELGGLLRFLEKSEIELGRKKIVGRELLQELISILKNSCEFILNTTVINISKEKKLCRANHRGVLRGKTEKLIVAIGGREINMYDLRIFGFRPAGVFTSFTALELMRTFKRGIGRRIALYGDKFYLVDVASKSEELGSEIVALITPNSIPKHLEELAGRIPIVIENAKVTWIEGKSRLRSILIEKEDREKVIEADTLIIGFGFTPEPTILWKAGAEIDLKTETPILDKNNQTTLEGIYAVGYSAKPYEKIERLVEDIHKVADSI